MTRLTVDAWATRFLETLNHVDDAMVASGAPAISDRWWQLIERYTRSGRLQCVVRKGRRVGASSIVAPRLCVAFILACQHRVPPGEYLTALFISVRRSEAADRLRNVKATLDTLGVHYEQKGDTLELVSLQWVVRVGTANLAEVGGTYGFVWDDELPRQREGDTLRNPSGEVVRGFKPGTATVPFAQVWLVGSPMGFDDFHAQEFERGDTDDQVIDCFATWEANPTLSLEDTKRLEPDLKIWSREYAAEPQSAISPAFDADAVERCFRDDTATLRRGTWGPNVLGIDASAGGACEFVAIASQYLHPPDGTGVVLAEWLDSGLNRDLAGDEVDPADFLLLPEPDTTIANRPRRFAFDHDGLAIPAMARTFYPGPILVLCDAYVEPGGWHSRMPLKQVVANAATFRRGVRHAFGDSYLGVALVDEFVAHHVEYTPLDWSTRSKTDAVAHLRHLMAERRLYIPSHWIALKKQMLRYSEIILPSGALKYSGRRQGHLDDQVSALLSLAMADAEGLVPRRRRGPARGTRSMEARQALFTE